MFLLGIMGVAACVFGWGSEAFGLGYARQMLMISQTALQIRETTSAFTWSSHLH